VRHEHLFDITGDLARRQHGRVARWQLLEAGLGRGRIGRWVRAGLLRPAHHGVYAVGHDAPSWRADYMAAVLACGPGAAISYLAAASSRRWTASRSRRSRARC
jgi:hypothetical protein